ncbi:MAG: putative thiolase [Firmicutes bacterium]|nr:putative thiolase [Bacillota bacterium]
MENVYILGGLRSHIGLKNGIFKNVLPEDLGASLLKELIKKYQLKKIDQIICGNAVGTGGNIARLMALKAGVGEEVPAFTIDMQCSSACMSMDVAFAKIGSGQCDLVIAGGIESSSLQPIRSYVKNDSRYSEKNPSYTVAQFSPNENNELVMLEGAERVAQKEKVAKAELDFWSLESHRRAKFAKENARLDDVILPLYGSNKDEGIRERMSQKLLDRLPTLLGGNTLTTSGNSCLINDGAAFVVLCSEKFLQQNNSRSLAQMINSCSIGANPLYSPMAAMKTTDKLLGLVDLKYSDIANFEFNEAFAVIDVLFERKYPELIDRYNIFGGALAYGHPYGASGGIIMLHLLKALDYTKGLYGVCSIAGAGGLGSAILIKRITT